MAMENGDSKTSPSNDKDHVRVAVNIRPLITSELLLGCTDCITVVPGEPQVQIDSHAFTFDYVFGNGGIPCCRIFDDCVAPLIDALFRGYNATVLAYGQTGSGKTYTMGTNYNGVDNNGGIIPKVMETIFSKVESMKDMTEFIIRVSFIEIFKEEVFDLLDPNPPIIPKGDGTKTGGVARAPIQIREAANGGITLAGVTVGEVRTKEEMASYLSHGSLARATGSTNMNNQSSRSHAIFTISVEQKRIARGSIGSNDDPGDDILSAKLHLVDLAGSERAKRTGAVGMRLKEGIHINKGLLALGNVISALGDEKKRKEGGHVPYRDSKLTRLLQDSLGGNSKTVMIACISPADTNAEETLNTLKYANRARNIQNKAIINRDPVAAEMQRMRSQIEQLQAEVARLQHLNSMKGDHDCGSFDDESLPSKNACFDGLSDLSSLVDTMAEDTSGDEDDQKELEHSSLQERLDRELKELDNELKTKEAEMKRFANVESSVLKQHFEKKVLELEHEKKALQREIEGLRQKLANIPSTSDDGAQQLKEEYLQKLNGLEAQVSELKKKQEAQAQLLRQKQRSDDAAKRLQDEIQRIKSQKVQLQNKIKQESEQFRLWKASREKEVLQLKKEGRRNEYEMHKLLALNQRQKMVLQRKTEEAAMATKRLKELLESRKEASREASAGGKGPGLQALMQAIEHELEVTVRVHEVRSEYERQMEVRVRMAQEIANLKEEAEMLKKNSLSSCPETMSPGARNSRIFALENMLATSSSTLVSMASQLSEAEERERFFSGRGRWNQVRSLVEAKNLMNYLFNLASSSRCMARDKEADCREKEAEIKELKEKIIKLNTLVKQLQSQNAELTYQIQQRAMSSNQTSEARAYDLRQGPRRSGFFNFGSAFVEALEEIDSSESDPSHSGADTDLEWEQSKRKARKRNSKKGTSTLNVEEDATTSTEKPTPALCCSCSSKSYCKTNKCECLAFGKSCSQTCGCLSAKCTNRNASNENVIFANEMQQTGDLASQGVALLENALSKMPPTEQNEENGVRRKALADIGNKVGKSNAPKSTQRKKWRKSVIQLVPAAPASTQPENVEPQLQKQETSTTETSNIPLKLPRAMRSAASNNSLLRDKNSEPQEQFVNKDLDDPTRRTPPRRPKKSEEKENCGFQCE